MGVALTNADSPAFAAMVTCHTCQRGNPVARRFCGGCGQPLWQSCPQCAAECAVDERFCGSCGGDVTAGVDKQHQQHQATLDEAVSLAARHEYDVSLASLRGLATLTDARFRPWAEQARSQIARIEEGRARWTAAAEEALAVARRQFEAQSYEHAEQALEGVPPPMRTAAHLELLEQAKACRQEVLALSGEIRSAVAEKRIADLGPGLQRLLELKPDHTQARQLAEQLRALHLKSAQARLTEHRYQEALDRLEQIPAAARNEDVEKLHETARELACLLDQVRGGAVADARLVKLAERLCKVAPANAEATKLRGELVERARQQPADPRLGAPDWQPPPKRTILGPPVDWLANFARSAAADGAVAQTLREHPGQFFVALGLALEGVGLAAVEANLTPREKGGFLGALPTIGLGRRGATAAWGIDLSETALKAVKLVRDGGEVKVVAAEYLPLRRPPGQAINDAQRLEMVTAALQDFAARAGELKGAKVCLGVTGLRVLGRFFELPPMPARRVADAVRFEAQHQLPLPLDELCWSWHAADQAAGKQADQEPRRVMVQAAKESYVRERIGMFQATGIAVDLVQSDCVALHNTLAFEFLGGCGSRSEPRAGGDHAPTAAVCSANHSHPRVLATIDLGAENANVVISSSAGVWFRTFGLGGDSFARELARQMQLTHEQAEQVLHEPARARRLYRYHQVLSPLFVQLGSEILRSLAAYHKFAADRPVRQIYGLGGAFPALGLLRYLRAGK